MTNTNTNTYTIYEYTGNYNPNRTYFKNYRRGYTFHHFNGTKAEAMVKAEQMIAEGKRVTRITTLLGTVIKYY